MSDKLFDEGPWHGWGWRTRLAFGIAVILYPILSTWAHLIGHSFGLEEPTPRERQGVGR